MRSHPTRRLRRTLLAPVLAAGLLLGGALPTQAATSAAPAAVSVTDDSVELSWSAVSGATAYLVIDDRAHEVLWRGEQTAATLPVQAPTSVSVLVVALTEQGPRLVAKTLATVPDAASGLTPLTAVTTPTGTTLGWGALPDAADYEITADGKKLTTTSAVQLPTETALGENAEYTIDAELDLPAGEITEDTVTRSTYGVEVTPATTDVSQTPGDAQPGDTLPANVRALTTSRTTYETYIPMSYLQGESWGFGFPCESADDNAPWFSGDGRSTGYETGKNRTKAASNHYWTSASTWTSKGISPTKRYRKVGSTYYYDSQRTAGGDGFVIRPLQNDGRYARTVIEHNVGNPYCTGIADISYDNQQDLYQNGSHWVYGAHDKMPNHQFYRYDQYSDGTYNLKLVFDHALDDPKCLAGWMGGCSAQQYQYTR
ncbi:hypothetical protein J7E88_35090 [Streptomyces sp. ISL-10]|uniref:hypothetical protein n=1 Tax=Streptomyces sp. ISL-10 TaxID=2819172 RepID=UPI001BE591D1|nr:hypothetical protein [Streptomyces sp. ISL-10]MBT2370358.1 hypothetical protein [Streptomyces sp. ISL-10]